MRPNFILIYKKKGQRGLTICLDKLQQVCERQSYTILTEDVWRLNFFFSGLTFFAELAQENAQDLATVRTTFHSFATYRFSNTSCVSDRGGHRKFFFESANR
jgi:hypothetical protein